MPPDPADILPPGEPPARREPPITDPAKRACGFCDCTITRHGEVLHLGDAAKRFQKHERTIEGLNERVAALEAENRELRAKLAEAQPTREKGSHLLI